MAKKKTPEICKGCLSWESFGEGCWFFWEEKKECPNHSDGFKSIKERYEIIPQDHIPV